MGQTREYTSASTGQRTKFHNGMATVAAETRAWTQQTAALGNGICAGPRASPARDGNLPRKDRSTFTEPCRLVAIAPMFLPTRQGAIRSIPMRR